MASLLMSIMNGVCEELSKASSKNEMWDAMRPGQREKMFDTVDNLRKRQFYEEQMRYSNEQRMQKTKSQSSSSGGLLALGALAVVGIGAALMSKNGSATNNTSTQNK